MDAALDRFLRDYCEGAECNFSNEAFPLEYAVKHSLIRAPGWKFWLKFNADYTTGQVVAVDKNDEVYVSNVGTSYRLTLSWVLNEIAEIVADPVQI